MTCSVIYAQIEEIIKKSFAIMHLNRESNSKMSYFKQRTPAEKAAGRWYSEFEWS